MKRLVLFPLLLAALMIPALVQAQQTIPRLPIGGPQLISGDTINQLIDRLSGSGTAANPTLCTVTGGSPQTCNGYRGLVTTATLTNATGVGSTFVINNSFVAATSVVECNLQAYTGAGIPVLMSCTPTAGVLTLTINNAGAAALNAAATISFIVFN
jgi:hypothetical protein